MIQRKSKSRAVVSAVITVSLVAGVALSALAETEGHIYTVAGTGTIGFTDDGALASGAAIYYPGGIAVDVAGNVYFAEQLAHKVRRIDAATGILTTVAGNGSQNVSGDGGPATEAGIASPLAITLDNFGNLYLEPGVGGGEVRKVDACTGTISGVAPIFSTLRINPALAVDRQGNIYTIDLAYDQVFKTKPGAGTMPAAGNGTVGFSGDGALAVAASLGSPVGLALDSGGNLYIADTGNNRVRKVDVRTGIITTVAAVSMPGAIAVSKAGNIYVTSTPPTPAATVVMRIDAVTGSVTTIAGGGTSTADDILATSSAFNASSLAVDRSGNLYMTDTVANRIAKVVTSDIAPPTFGDVTISSIYSGYVEALASAGITTGCGGGNYCPGNNVTRGQMAVFIERALQHSDTFTYTTDPYFADVPTDDVYFKYVQRLKDDGLTAVSGSYDLNGLVSRGQMAAFLVRAKYGEDFSYTATPYFSDVPPGSTFFKYVQKLKDAKITATTGTYGVDSPVTREQMAAFLSRAFLGVP